MHAMTRADEPRAKINRVVQFEAALVRDAIEADASRREQAKAARAGLALRELVQARAELRRMTRGRDAWRRWCVAAFGLVAITWGMAGAFAMLAGG